jgi:hypothetical protein
MRGPRMRERSAGFSASAVATEFDDEACGGGDLSVVTTVAAGEAEG